MALAKSVQFFADALADLSRFEFDGMQAGFGFWFRKRSAGGWRRARLWAQIFHRVPDDRIALRRFFGGTSDEAVLGESDEALIAIARGIWAASWARQPLPSNTSSRWRSWRSAWVRAAQRGNPARAAGNSGAPPGGQRV
jgi:hypothetical protein